MLIGLFICVILLSLAVIGLFYVLRHNMEETISLRKYISLVEKNADAESRDLSTHVSYCIHDLRLENEKLSQRVIESPGLDYLKLLDTKMNEINQRLDKLPTVKVKPAKVKTTKKKRK